MGFMRKLSVLEKNINILELDNSIADKLKDLNIIKISDLWECKLSFLKESNFDNSEINQIRIKLQLKGIDLNKKVY